jgi:MoaA/NifB/PqqE/SkfB family radical SAM enzyme
MRIIYDDTVELAEVAIRCNDTVRSGKCAYCPFFDKCAGGELEDRYVLCGEIEGAEKK